MDLTRLNMRHLHAVVATAHEGSISAAAHVVNLSQPAITQGIAKIEQQLGVALFDRQPGGMKPTPSGHALARRVAAALRLIGPRVPTVTQMNAFAALTRSGSYAAAARETGLSVASLHRAVADLALTRGHRLVERRGRGIVLTARGFELARRIKLSLAELRSAATDLAELQGRKTGRIAIGAMPLSRARLLPNVAAAFYKLHPQIELTILEGSYAELIGPLRDGEVDLLIGALRDSPDVDELVERPLFEDHPVILARPGHPLAGDPALDAAALGHFPWVIAAEGTPLRRQWSAMFTHEGLLPPKVPIECGSVLAARQIVIQSDFLTLLSPDQVVVELEAGWLVKIAAAPPHISRMIGFTVRADWRPTGIQQEFLNLMTAEGDSIKAAARYS